MTPLKVSQHHVTSSSLTVGGGNSAVRITFLVVALSNVHDLQRVLDERIELLDSHLKLHLSTQNRKLAIHTTGKQSA